MDTTIEHLEREIVRLAGDLERRMAHWLPLLADFDRLGGARRWGFRSTAEWLAWSCAIGQRAAREHVRVARRLTELAEVREAFSQGELSYSKVRAITRAAASENESELVARARSSTAAQLERHVRALRSAPSADIDVANAAHERRFLDWSWEADGSLRVVGRLSPEDGAALIEAVETAAEALHDGTGPRPPAGARRADALTEMAISGAPRAQIVLHVDEPALACTARADEVPAGTICALEDGPAVPSETARRLACDAELVEARRGAGGTIDHGRRRRVVSPPLRASLERRDKRCRFPGCARRHHLHAHHIEHWAFGGRTDRDNLVLLCRFHHRLVHEEGFAIARRDGELEFARPDRTPVRIDALRAHPPPTAVAA